MANRDDSGLFFSGLVFGALGGFIAGVLMAEKPGRELRKDLELNSSEFVYNIKDKLQDIKEEASVKMKDFAGFTDEKFKRSAMNIQEKVAELGKQLEELTVAQASKDNN